MIIGSKSQPMYKGTSNLLTIKQGRTSLSLYMGFPQTWCVTLLWQGNWNRKRNFNQLIVSDVLCQNHKTQHPFKVFRIFPLAIPAIQSGKTRSIWNVNSMIGESQCLILIERSEAASFFAKKRFFVFFINTWFWQIHENIHHIESDVTQRRKTIQKSVQNSSQYRVYYTKGSLDWGVYMQ